MTKIDYDEVIADCLTILEDRNPHFTDTTLKEVVRALQQAKADAGKFDVLTAIENGREIVDNFGVVWRPNEENLYCAEDNNQELQVYILTALDWQPYTPPIEDQLEDGQLYHTENGDNDKAIHLWKRGRMRDIYTGKPVMNDWQPQPDSKGRPIKCGPVDNGE